jgi:hypothetical protein
LDCSKIFERLATSAGQSANARLAEPVRLRGHRGGIIIMHRALAHFTLKPVNLLSAISLFLLFSGVWLIELPRTCALWSQILAAGIRYLPLHADLLLAERHITSYLTLEIPYLDMDAVPPSLSIWWLTCGVTVLLFAVTFFFPNRWIPVVYLVRGVSLVQVTALVYFALFPAAFPHSPASYMGGLSTYGLALISIVPCLFGLTYYIFDFGLPKKAFLTIVTMAHLTLFMPFQILLQGLVLQGTILFMPLLYIVFGIPIDVLLIIAFYSWGMSWPFRSSVRAKS